MNCLLKSLNIYVKQINEIIEFHNYKLLLKLFPKKIVNFLYFSEIRTCIDNFCY